MAASSIATRTDSSLFYVMLESNELLHIQQYLTTDYARHTDNIAQGLFSGERHWYSSIFDPSLKTLELGCSAGRLSFGLERDLNFKDITALDIIEEFIQRAKSEAIKVSSNITFIQGDIRNLQFKDESFDQVIAGGVLLSHLVHRNDRMKAFSEIHRVLRKNGLVALNVRNINEGLRLLVMQTVMNTVRRFYNPSNFGNSVLPRLGKGGKPDWLFFLPKKAQLYFYRADELVHDLLSVGFSIESLSNNKNLEKDRSTLPFDKSGYCLNVTARKK